MLKGVSLLVIAVLLVTQAGCYTDTGSGRSGISGAGNGAGRAVQRDTAGADAGDAGRTKSCAPRADEEVQENMAVLKIRTGRERRICLRRISGTRTRMEKKQDYGKELITSNETGIAYRTENGSGELKLPSTLTANTPVQYEQNGLKITMAPTLDRVVSVPLPAVEARDCRIELPGQTWDGTIGRTRKCRYDGIGGDTAAHNGKYG